MSMAQATFNPEPLTPCETDILERFFCKLVMDNKQEFTSDDFRAYGLDKKLYGEESQKTGLLFWKAKRAGMIEDTGRRKASTIQTNHFRENKVYTRSGKT